MQRYRTLFLTLALLTAPLTFIVAPGAADLSCNMAIAEDGLIGTAEASPQTWTIAIDADCRGESFVLNGQALGDDFDIVFSDGTTFGNGGDESGIIPVAATSATITYWTGVDTGFTFTAQSASAGDCAITLRGTNPVVVAGTGAFAATYQLPGRCQGGTFALAAGNDHSDLDLCFDDDAGTCFTGDGDKAGATPIGADWATIDFNQAAATYWTLSFQATADTEPPSGIDAISAAARNHQMIDLAWDAATDNVAVASYDVAIGPDGSTWTDAASTALTAFVHGDLAPDTSYFYRVRAVDVAGNEGAWSTVVGVTTDAEPITPPPSGEEPRPITVIAVIDSAYNPYHFDFVGHQHPWNTDADPSNDFDFAAHPSTYIDGYPEDIEAVTLTMPTSGSDNVNTLKAGDQATWDDFPASSGSGDNFELRWLPGTKIVGAAHFGSGFYGSNGNHGTRSAASAGGNIHGTCPECVFVLISGLGNTGVTWAAKQPWIDVVTNSWESCYPTCVTRSGVYPGAVSDTWKDASEDGQVIVFAAGNGHANAFVAPQLGYFNGQKGTDWLVKVGAVSPSNDQSYTGSTKPVDISSIGSSYPSTGGTTATGTGTHSGTSNAAPVAAGYIAQVLQNAREQLGDVTPGPEGNGVIASGTAVACGVELASCPLGDGVLTRAELRDLVYYNVLPDAGVSCCSTTVPNTEYNYASMGHGVLHGIHGGKQAYLDQLAHMDAVAIGDADYLPRPDGEANWFIIDSKCRQKLTGAWTGGYWQGTQPDLDPAADPLALATDTWCSNLPVRWS